MWFFFWQILKIKLFMKYLRLRLKISSTVHGRVNSQLYHNYKPPIIVSCGALHFNKYGNIVITYFVINLSYPNQYVDKKYLKSFSTKLILKNLFVTWLFCFNVLIKQFFPQLDHPRNCFKKRDSKYFDFIEQLFLVATKKTLNILLWNQKHFIADSW